MKPIFEIKLKIIKQSKKNRKKECEIPLNFGFPFRVFLGGRLDFHLERLGSPALTAETTNNDTKNIANTINNILCVLI